jgi:phosphomevalonate kinase
LFVTSSAATMWSVRWGACAWNGDEDVLPELAFAIEATREAARLGAAPRALVTHDHLAVDGVKLGLGSSAAATVATLRAATEGLSLTETELWRRADAIHRALQGGRGSGADVAATVHGGLLLYTREPTGVVPVHIHPDVRLVALRTEASVKTAPRLARFEAFVAAHPPEAARFESLSERGVAQLALALASGDATALREAVAAAREALLFLQARAGLELETPTMRRAIDLAAGLGVGAKQSGAGGGDCAVAIAPDEDAARRLMKASADAGLGAFLLPVAKEGVREEGL